MSKSQIKPLAAIAVIVIMVFSVIFGADSIHELDLQGILGETETKSTDLNSPGPYKVVSVVDGDTVRLNINGETTTVRLIGIDAPESVHPNGVVECYGKEASNHLKSMLSGASVTIYTDETQDNIDRYGRPLRYIYLKDGTNVNQQMILDGYAYEYTYRTPYKYQSQFKAAQQYAEQNQNGLWGAVCSQ